MKILCVWLDQLAYGISYEQLNYPYALKKLGHNVRIMPIVADRPCDAMLIDSIRLTKPDIALFKLYRKEIRKETIDYITKNTKTITACIFGDDEKYFYKKQNVFLEKDGGIYTEEYAPYFDYCITMTDPAKEWYDKIGVKNVIFTHYTANPQIYRKLKTKHDIDTSFCGAKTDERVRTFDAIATSGIRLKVFGNGWDEQKSMLAVEQYAALFNQTKVNLNISIDTIDGRKFIQIKGRDFEVPMCGGFLLTHENPYLEKIYKVGKEIETYGSVKELISKIKFYVKNDSAREKIALAGYRRAQKDHTPLERFKKILPQIRGKQ